MSFHTEFPNQVDQFVVRTGRTPNVILCSAKAIEQFDEIVRENSRWMKQDRSAVKPRKAFMGCEVIRAEVPYMMAAEVVLDPT